MKSLIRTALLAIALPLAQPAFASITTGFVGAFDLSLWQAGTAADGSIDLAAGPLSVSFVGSDDGSGPASQSLTILAPAAGIFSFSWAYTTQDIAPVFDAFGVLINGVFGSVSVDTDPATQSGTAWFNVAAADAFGFSVQSFDSTGGRATAVVSAFQFVEAPPLAVPEPGQFSLLGLVLAAAAAVTRSGRRTQASGTAAQEAP